MAPRCHTRAGVVGCFRMLDTRSLFDSLKASANALLEAQKLPQYRQLILGNKEGGAQ
jgi:hypothetical protein